MAHITRVIAGSPSARPQKSLRLHELLGSKAAWSDVRWDEATIYLDGRLNMPQVVEPA